ncbi:MAG: hypothetical protein ACI8XO_003957, partial [Verrucomicrobiales bacterium]
SCLSFSPKSLDPKHRNQKFGGGADGLAAAAVE